MRHPTDQTSIAFVCCLFLSLQLIHKSRYRRVFAANSQIQTKWCSIDWNPSDLKFKLFLRTFEFENPPNFENQIWPKSCANLYILVPVRISTFWSPTKNLAYSCVWGMSVQHSLFTCVTTLARLALRITTLNSAECRSIKQAPIGRF